MKQICRIELPFKRHAGERRRAKSRVGDLSDSGVRGPSEARIAERFVDQFRFAGGQRLVEFRICEATQTRRFTRRGLAAATTFVVIILDIGSSAFEVARIGGAVSAQPLFRA